jgi:hypothetical protein
MDSSMVASCNLAVSVCSMSDVEIDQSQ